MTKKIKIGNLTVDVFFNEYNKSRKTRRQISGHELTIQDKRAIDRGLDDTDFGEFYRYVNKDVEITGMFNVVDSEYNELD